MIKDVAKAYARAGYRVLCTYGLAYEEDTGEWVCSCPSPNDMRYRHGKHPLFGSHGVNDASTEPDAIDAWPDTIPLNVAIALTDTLVVIDIDDPQVAAALLDPALGLRDVATISTTGRGLHLWLACAPTASGILKHKATTERIGEIRASGWYVVVPPSRHSTGRQYAWLGPTLLEHGPTRTTQDAWSYARELLASVGVEFIDRRDVAGHQLRDVGIVPTQLPYQTDNAKLLALLSPVHPVQDRSGALFHLACETLRDAHARQVTIDTATLAGIVKHVDRIRQHPRGPKFAWRDNADDCYWDLAIEAARSVEADAPPADPPKPVNIVQDTSTDTDDAIITDADDPQDAQQRQQARGTYYYDEQAGFIDNSNPKRPVRLANFETLIFERVLYHLDEYEQPSKGSWGLRARKGTEEYVFHITPEEYQSHHGVIHRARTELPPHFVIENRRASDWETAIKLYSPPVQPRSAYAMTGWIPGRDAFLLPGLPGAIVPEGFDPSIVFEAAPNTPEEIALPRTISYDAHPAETARALFASAPPGVIMPLMAQILAAPLVSVGHEHVTLVHLYGASNSFKTSLATSLFAFYGWAAQRTAMGIYSWSADTPGVLRDAPYYYRDLPVLFDDYKAGTHRDESVTALIQSYGDQRGRGRLSQSGTMKKGKTPRGLIVSTGEDVWEDQRSTNTRSLFIKMEGADQEAMFRLSALAREGALGALGVSWIRWLTRQGRERLHVQLAAAQEKYRPEIEERIGDENPRIVSGFTALFVVSMLFRSFLRDEAPTYAAEYDELRAIGWMQQLAASQAQAEEALASTPLTQLLSTLSEAVAFGKAYFLPKLAGGEYLGTVGSDPVGYVMDDAVFLSKPTTFGWYQEECRRQGRGVGFGWVQVVNEARARFGATSKVEYVNGKVQRERMLRIPIEAILVPPVTSGAVTSPGEA